jgi:hypothetical protein
MTGTRTGRPAPHSQPAYTYRLEREDEVDGKLVFEDATIVVLRELPRIVEWRGKEWRATQIRAVKTSPKAIGFEMRPVEDEER